MGRRRKGHHQVPVGKGLVLASEKHSAVLESVARITMSSSPVPPSALPTQSDLNRETTEFSSSTVRMATRNWKSTAEARRTKPQRADLPSTTDLRGSG